MATALLSGADPDDVLRTVSTQVLGAHQRRHGRGADAQPRRRRVHDHRGRRWATPPTTTRASGCPWTGTYLGAMHEAGVPRLIEDISTMPMVGPRAARRRGADRRASAPAWSCRWATRPGGACWRCCGPPAANRSTPTSSTCSSAFAAQAVGRPGAGPRPAARAPAAGAGRPRPHRPRPARPRRPADLRHRPGAGPDQPLPGGGAPGRRRAHQRAGRRARRHDRPDPLVDLRAPGGRGRLPGGRAPAASARWSGR